VSERKVLAMPDSKKTLDGFLSKFALFCLKCHWLKMIQDCDDENIFLQRQFHAVLP